MLIFDREKLKKFTSSHRVWQGIPGIARTKGGRTFVSFYSGETKETYGNYALVVMSEGEDDFGEPILAAKKEGKFRCFDPVLWIDPENRLWFIWNVMPGEEVWASICENPDEEKIVWGKEFLIGRGIMMNKPLVLTTGKWLFPIAIWKLDIYHDFRKSGLLPSDVAASYVYKTADNGRTFTRLGGADVRGRSFDEHMLIETDSGVLRMLVRLEDGIGESYSYDRGRNWSRGQKTDLGGPSSRFFIKRLRSGRVLLINHYNFDKRNNLTALLSEDGGRTFTHTLLLDGRMKVSYPDAMEANDGFIYIVYDRERGCDKASLEEVYSNAREILTARIKEEDIIAGALVSEGSYLKKTVSKLGALAKEDGDPFCEPNISDADFAKMLIETGDGDPIGKVFERYPVNCVNTVGFDAGRLDALISRFVESKKKDVCLLKEIIAFIKLAPKREKEFYPIIEKAKEYIDTHLSEDFTVSELAKDMNISVYYLSHLFKEVSGTTLIEYRNELRLTKAKIALINTDKTVSEIAQELGFCSAAYFTEIFSRSEKIPPSEFRKFHKKRA